MTVSGWAHTTHLGVETQRQWSDNAIAPTTPVLFGLFSLVCVMAHRLTAAGATLAAPYHRLVCPRQRPRFPMS